MSGAAQDVAADDAEFQQGIQAIIAPMIEQGASEDEIKAVIARARQFYAEHNSTASASASSAPAAGEGAPAQAEKYPTSFNQIVELIATGQEDKIPGVRDIPLKINESAPSTSTLARPKKPWEP